MDELGIHIETNASEAGAAAMLGASINYPLRGAVTFKSTVGTNVASDALSNLASVGVAGGALIVLGEDYGEGASIIQERSHAFAMKSQMWLLDPRPSLPTITRMVEKGFELSEASSTPVLLELRIRACHVHGSFPTKPNRAPAVSRRRTLESPVFDFGRIALPPSTYAQEKHKIEVRWPAAVKFVIENALNETFDGAADDVGIICQGGMYNVVVRALQQLGLANALGETQIPIWARRTMRSAAAPRGSP
jgi:indolepyruvate ferredoxin oxidoreductase alpha subunit